MAHLTGRSSIATWLEDAEGGPLIRGLLAQAGVDETALAPIRDLPLQQLVALSQGRMPASVIDDLVKTVNGGVTPEDDVEEAVATAGDRFRDRTVIVTGAGSGIGRVTAMRIVREGGRVVGVDLAADRLDEVAAALPEGAFVPVVANITLQKDVDAIVAAAGERIDGLANIAGVMDDFSPTHETTDAMWNRVIGVNLTGTFLLSRAVIPAMRAARHGAIVNVSSEAGLRGTAAGAAYTASKHGVVGLTRSTAVMYAEDGIRTNAVAPGGVATGMAMPAQQSELGTARLTPFRATIPPVALPERIAAAITFLLSDDSGNINGVILPSDGGWSAQ